MRSHHAQGGQLQRGYVLPLTLAVLVMLTLIAAQVGRVSKVAIDQVIASRQRVQAEYALENAKAEILYMLALVPRGARGLGEGVSLIIPDDRTYAFNETVRVRFQDLRGLLPLNASLDSPVPSERLTGLLKTYGIQADKITQMLDALQDYRDKDDFRRVNGAEKTDYAAAGKLAPRNADLIDPSEIYRVMGWAEENNRWQKDDILQYLSIQRLQSFNPNVASARVIAAITGMSLDAAQSIVAQRSKTPGADIAPLLFSSLGDPFGSAGFVLRSVGPSLKVTLWQKNQSWAWQFLVHHTPDEVAGPWRVGNFTQVALPDQMPDSQQPEPLPKLQDLRPLVAPRIEYRF